MFKTVTPESALRSNGNGEGSWLVIHRFGSAIEKNGSFQNWKAMCLLKLVVEALAVC